MNQRHEEEPESGKRKRLDELFADEPFLSPTMRARRLHEKLLEQSVAENSEEAGPGTTALPREAYVRAIPERTVRRDPGVENGAAEARGATYDGPPISLTDAAIFLRSRGTQAPRSMPMAAQESLRSFRDSTLKAWLTAMQDR